MKKNPISRSSILSVFTFFRFLEDFWFFHHVEGVKSSGPKIFLWLQKWCSKHLEASTASWTCNIGWTKTVVCVEQKRRNEIESHLMFKHFIDFHIFQIFRSFLIFSLCWRCRIKWLYNFFHQYVFKNHFNAFGASITSRICNSRWIKSIACVVSIELKRFCIPPHHGVGGSTLYVSLKFK